VHEGRVARAEIDYTKYGAIRIDETEIVGSHEIIVRGNIGLVIEGDGERRRSIWNVEANTVTTGRRPGALGGGVHDRLAGRFVMRSYVNSWIGKGLLDAIGLRRHGCSSAAWADVPGGSPSL